MAQRDVYISERKESQISVCVLSVCVLSKHRLHFEIFVKHRGELKHRVGSVFRRRVGVLKVADRCFNALGKERDPVF